MYLLMGHGMSPRYIVYLRVQLVVDSSYGAQVCLQYIVSQWRSTHGFLVCLCESYYRPCSAHAGYIGTERSLLTGHDALLLRQTAGDLLYALSHRHDCTWTAFVEPVVSTDGSKLITCW